jgi:hypothetical protein
MDKEIVIKPKYELKEYFKVSLYVTLRHPLYIVLMIFFGLMTLSVLALLILGILGGVNNFLSLFDPVYIVLIIWPALVVYFTYIKTKKALESPRLKEDITIKYTNNFFQETGETFDIKYYWKDIKKIIETKKWFLIYIQSNQAKVIIKKDLNQNEYNDLKKLFNSLTIKKSLK